MAALDPDYDIFKATAVKLRKKRVIRKPNYGEAVAELGKVQQNWKRKGQFKYNTLCTVAIARCEEALHSSSLAAQHFVDAGHLFWTQELEHGAFRGANDTDEEEEQRLMAIDCYLDAIRIYTEQNRLTLAAALYNEMGASLKTLERYSESFECFQAAADTYQLPQLSSQINAIAPLQEAVDCCWALKDYGTACSVLNWIIKLASEGPDIFDIDDLDLELPRVTDECSISLYSQILVESRISFILLLVLQGEFRQASDFVNKLVQDANHNHTGVVHMGTGIMEMNHVVSLFAELVKFCQSKDLAGLEVVHRDLWTHLTNKQNQMLLLLMQELGREG